MRFMIIVKATGDSEAGALPEPELIARMTEYHEELAHAGLLLDASGLRPTAHGWRVRYDGERSTVVDGPFAETKELIAGYTIIQANSREEALEWTRRFPNPAVDGGKGEIEVRPLADLDDLGQGPALERFRELQKNFTSAPTA
ncbi:MAG TPA: YciI family protein [Steroidobacteraceae bacterium]|nr:YciI family protein [Steroidobacteraceae bacterium]